MNCTQCDQPGATLTKRVRGVAARFCDTSCESVYTGWLKVRKDMRPWADALHQVLNELHTIHPHDQEACDFYNEWSRAITSLSGV